MSYGFTENIKISSYRGNYNALGYNIHAENKYEECYNEVNCEGLMFNIAYIIHCMADHNIEIKYSPFTGREYSIKELLKM